MAIHVSPQLPPSGFSDFVLRHEFFEGPEGGARPTLRQPEEMSGISGWFEPIV